jgi:predicted NUDIX family phosphoesterase
MSRVPIAVVRRAALEAVVPLRNGFLPADVATLRAVEALVEWMPRDEAERDERFKQLIPYAVARRGDRVFATERLSAGTESRLHGRIAVGIGGHVERADATLGPSGTGLRDEWAEEVRCDVTPEFAFRGFVNDDGLEVGRVHIGVVYECQLPASATLTVRETEKLRGSFESEAWLRDRWERLETWSRFVLSGLRGGS